MQLLILGMPRTGTQSLADALIQLGISPVYHMREVAKNKHQALWNEALEAKFEGNGKPWSTREDFNRILSGYEALADYPASIFAEDLIAAYPEAVIILTVRDEEAWYKSMLATLWHGYVNSNPKSRLMSFYHQNIWHDDFPAKGKEAYRVHNEAVRKAAQGRRFLEYGVAEGWGPLCEFLGKEVPKGGFPRTDDWAAYKKEHSEK